MKLYGKDYTKIKEVIPNKGHRQIVNYIVNIQKKMKVNKLRFDQDLYDVLNKPKIVSADKAKLLSSDEENCFDDC